MMNLKYYVRSKISSFFTTTYYKIPVGFRFFFVPAKFILRLVNRVRLKQWIITGEERSSKEKLAVIYSGGEKSKNFFVKLVFDNFCREKYLGKTWIWKISQRAKKKDQNFSLMVTEVHESFLKYFCTMKCFYIPDWIHLEVDISAEMSLLIKNRGLKSDISRIRKNKLNFELTNEPDRFKDFYYNMYVPYTIKVHENRAVVHQYEHMKKEFKNCDLLLLKKEQEYIAGILIYYMKNKARLWSSGVKDGNLDYVVKDRVKGALYYFSILCLKEKGVKNLSFGLSRAFLNDGVLQYKKKWGLNIIGTTNQSFLIKPLSKTNGVKGFFLNNPFIYYSDNKRYNGAIFVENNHTLLKKDLEKIYKNYYINGMSKLYIYKFREDDCKNQDLISYELPGKIEICSFDDYFE